MRDRAEIDRIVAACLGNAEELLNAAKCVAQTSSNHVGYHLATLALEEIGKAAMISMSSLREATDEERKGPIDWIDNHQRKLFWALWSIRFDKEVPGKSIQEAMDIAKSVHETRLATLYVDPNDPDARTRITIEQLQNLIRLTEAQLELQKMKKLREPTGELKSDLDWFFAASENPQLRPIIFSQASFEKQAEFETEPFNGFVG
jgi:AbiV family abortive infection protein